LPLNSAGTIHISGMGCISAAGGNLEEHRQALAGKPVACGPVPDWLFATALRFPVFSAPRKVALEAAPFFDPDRLEIAAAGLSRTSRLALGATLQALDQADIDLTALRGKRVGICLGTTVGCAFYDEGYYRAWRQGARPPLEPVLGYLRGNISSALQAVLAVNGPNLVITNACASGTDAIGVAAHWLKAGRCDLAIAGGVDELSRIAYNGFAALQLTDSAPCRPYDESRQGLNLGEGAGILVLERKEEARRAGRSPLGVIHAYATASDAWHPTAPHPEGRGLQQALRMALRGGGRAFRSEDIGLINGHGTGTASNDVAETAALAAVFDPDYRPPLVSTKGITGHTLGGAGGLEAIFTLLALRDGRTRGACRCGRPDPAFRYQPLAEEHDVELTSRIGISQSLAFGGTNSCLILEAAA
jgi:3-oxoacyl-(acyl-carrier-protein) synthase